MEPNIDHKVNIIHYLQCVCQNLSDFSGKQPFNYFNLVESSPLSVLWLNVNVVSAPFSLGKTYLK